MPVDEFGRKIQVDTTRYRQNQRRSRSPPRGGGNNNGGGGVGEDVPPPPYRHADDGDGTHRRHHQHRYDDDNKGLSSSPSPYGGDPMTASPVSLNATTTTTTTTTTAMSSYQPTAPSYYDDGPYHPAMNDNNNNNGSIGGSRDAGMATSAATGTGTAAGGGGAMAERLPLFHGRGPYNAAAAHQQHHHHHPYPHHGGGRGGRGRGGSSSYHPHHPRSGGGRGGGGASPYYGQHRHHQGNTNRSNGILLNNNNNNNNSGPYGPSPSSNNNNRVFFGSGGRGGGGISMTPQSQQQPLPSSLSSQPHPSERYVTTPMLCGYLWKQQQQQKDHDVEQNQARDETTTTTTTTEENDNINKNKANKESDHENAQDDDTTNEKDEVEGKIAANQQEQDIKTEPISHTDQDGMEDDGDAELQKKQALESEYTAYRRQYCETYLKHVFNAHLDDSWFRQLFSPLARVQVAEWEQQRAQNEARAVWEDIREWQPNPLKNITLRTTLSLTTELDSPRTIPRFHIPRVVREGRLLQVQKVPPHVTHTQLWHALPPASRWIQYATEGEDNTKNSNSNPTPDTVLQLISSIPSQTHHTRTVYWVCPNKATADALWQAFLSLDGRTTTTADSTTAVPWEVDCPDPYRRTEYDVDGKGSAPEDGLGVPDRKAIMMVSPYNYTSTEANAVSVLSMSLSEPGRIPEDVRAATTLARALDVQQHVPTAYQLDSILETTEAGTMLDNKHAEEEGYDPQALKLDLALAYLRRVHLVNFYKGCQRAEFFGDVLAGNEAASTVQYRSVIRPEEESIEEKELTAKNREGGVEEGASSNEESSEKVIQEEGSNSEVKPDVKYVESEHKPPKSPAASVKDLLVQRLDDAIQHALNVTCHEWVAAADAVVDAQTDAVAEDLRRAEEDAEETWLRHHSIDDEGRARCSFHFCHKLFKDQSFLRKHLKKKHYEYCVAEQAKCHDTYMMKAWEGSGASRPRPLSASLVGPPRLIVPDILVDCGTKYGCLPAPLYHVKKPKSDQQQNNGDYDDEQELSSDDDENVVIVDVVDPEPALWQKEQEQERIDRERRQLAEEMRQRRREESRQQRITPSSAPRKDKFVDVDDMKEEEVVTMTFDQVELPQPKKKKKKRKLL